MSGIGKNECEFCKLKCMDVRTVKLRVAGGTKYPTPKRQMCESCRELHRGDWKYS